MATQDTNSSRIGFNVRRGRASRAAELIAYAENAGIQNAWMTMGAVGSDIPTLYAATAVQTQTIKLDTSIVPAFTRHPIALAGQALVLDDLAPGRLRLGIGTSHGSSMVGVYGFDFDRPLAQLREYLQVLRPLLHEGEVEFQGDFYHAKAKLPGAPKTPVLMSALGPKSFEAAGELTDGAISWITPFDYLRQTALPAMQRGAESAGRERPPLVAHVTTAIAPDRESAYNATREALAMYAKTTFYPNMFKTAGYPLGSGGEYTDELLDQLVVAGDPDTIGERLIALLQDFDELLIMPVPVTDREAEERDLINLIANL